MDPKALLLWLFLSVGGLLALISVPLILGKVGPNPWYGFRVKKTLDDPVAWYAANRYAAWWMLVAVGLSCWSPPASIPCSRPWASRPMPGHAWLQWWSG